MRCLTILIILCGFTPPGIPRFSGVLSIHPRSDGTSTQIMQSRAVDTRIELEVLEGQPKGTRVGYIPTKVGFTYRFNEPPGQFVLDSNTGEIKTAIVLDRENMPEQQNDRYDLVVLSSQPTYPIEVRITVIDVNDNAPEFPEKSIAISFSESAAAGTRLLLDAATDKDLGNNGVSDDYQIIDGNKEEKFRLVVTPNPTGAASYLHLETTGKLDRETQGFYILNISAKDGGVPPRFGFLQVNVTILDVNDNPPIFDHSDYSVSLNESVSAGTPVLQVMATDSDFGDNARITYYLADTERQFSVDPDLGIISTTEILQCPQQNCKQVQTKGNYCPKSCVFTVFARDHGTPRQDGRTYVTVNLLDANDHDPVIKFRYFPANAQYATVDENAINGSVVAAISVIDSDDGLNGETSVQIVSGNELNHFRLDYTQNFDIVRVNGILDREEINKYNLTIVATDKGVPARTATAFLIVIVNDVNDHEPVFEKSEYSTVLSELTPIGTYVASITATDADTGVNAQIYYSFVSGNDNQWFFIDTNSGLITTQKYLDREVQGSVELKIAAKDGGPNPKYAYTQLKITILDENDEAPEFSQKLIHVNLTENTPANTLIAMLTATDHDQGTNGSVTYSLQSDIEQNYPKTFQLDSLTGQLTTKIRLDREYISKYEIEVIAKDQGIPPQSSTATVYLNVLDVNDNSPEFYPQRYFVALPYNAKIGDSVLKVSAFDIDEGENAIITYNFENNFENIFSINDLSGVVYLKNNLTHPIYKLKVSATDRGNKRALEEAYVEIIRESAVEKLEFDNFLGYEFTLKEDNGFSDSFQERSVGRVSVKNFPNSVSYHIVYGDGKHNFKINENTGVISTNKMIDREEMMSYSLVIHARSGLSFGRAVVNISVQDLNDNAPEFLRENTNNVNLLENAAVGQEVCLARARDRDAGVNSRLTYNLAYNPEEQFRISETTGVVYLNRPIHVDPGTVLTIEATASDGGDIPLTTKHTISINIQDVNDHTPIFDHTSYETSLLESTAVNTRFFVLSASDTDLGDNGKISFHIIEGNNDEKFNIFPDGYLYVKSLLDREEKDYYALTVMVEDHGKPIKRSSTVPVVIHVIDENDNAPKFINSSGFTFHIRENEPVDSFVGKLLATDRDIGRNAELIYSLSSTQADFIVDHRNGFIKTNKQFDREELVRTTGQNFISFDAYVTDNGKPRLRDKVKVNVFITDVNDNPPVFLRTPYKVQISEGMPVGTQFIRMFTTDSDEGLNGDVFYSLTDGNEDQKFSIDEATGQITVAKKLDRELVDKYFLTVVAYDAGVTKRLSSSTVVEITILDENDNPPDFVQTSTNISVIETSQINTEIMRFHATDIDLGINSEITYSITSGNRRDTFHIDTNTGKLFLHKLLDYEDINLYQLNITASDNGNPKLSTTIIFQIKVLDANDNPPTFPTTAIVRQIREGIPINTPIVTIVAEDPDSGINGQVSYKLIHQEPYDNKRYFYINESTGIIHTLLEIDRESIDTFRLTILATDQALPKNTRLSAEKLVTVIVEDINDNAPIFVSMNAAMLPVKKTSLKRNDITFIMNVYAKDDDSSTNGLVTYELVSGNTDLFYLHRSTGTLSMRKSELKYEPRYQLAVKATDEAVQSERRSTDAYITLITPGGHTRGPIFKFDTLSGSVYENEQPGTSILTVTGHLENNNTMEGYSVLDIEYYVINITGDGKQVDRLFDIDTKMGVLSTAEILDREVGVDVYEVNVVAIVIGGSTPRTSNIKVRVFCHFQAFKRFFF